MDNRNQQASQATKDERLLLWLDAMKRQWFLGFFSYARDRVDEFRSQALCGEDARKLNPFNQMQWEMGGAERADYVEFWSANQDGILNLSMKISEALGVELELRQPLLADCEPPRDQRGVPLHSVSQ